jgi:xanthine dehydrogenase accessory factor
MQVMSDSLLDKAAALPAAGKPFALVTVGRAGAPTSAKPGAKALVDTEGNIEGWIGGGCAQPAVVKTARQALSDGRLRLIRISPGRDGQVEEGIVVCGMSCHSGRTPEIFIDPVLAILGTSPTAQSLVGLAARVGFEVSAGASPIISAALIASTPSTSGRRSSCTRRRGGETHGQGHH